MKSYVDGLLESELPRAVENVGVKLLRVTAHAQEANALSGSRVFIEYQTAIVKGIEEYGALLRQRLGQFEPDHAPLSAPDFEKAIASIDQLKDEALAMYAKKRENQKPFGGDGLPFAEERMSAAVDSAKNELSGLQASFRSHRSLVKRVMDKIIDTFGQQTALALWSALVFILGLYFSGPLASIVDWLKGSAR